MIALYRAGNTWLLKVPAGPNLFGMLVVVLAVGFSGRGGIA